MSTNAQSSQTTSTTDIDKTLSQLKDRAQGFRSLSPLDKSKLLRGCISRLREVAAPWVAKATFEKGLAPEQSGEDWLSGPLPTIRMARLLAESLERTHQHGAPSLGVGHRTNEQGRLCVDVFPGSTMDRGLFPFFSGYVLMNKGIDQTAAERKQKEQANPKGDGGLTIILGAGNVSSIPPMDVFTCMFIEGNVVCLKMNPVNEWLGPFLEQALAPLISKGYLSIVYGGAEVGAYLVEHPMSDHIHITGSDKTHDAIVWGADVSEQERRKQANDPKLKIPISSELGNISPVAIVPHDYNRFELWFQARNVATMMTNNASFNCNAAKMIITSKHWKQRDQFFKLIGKALQSIKTRKAYYPGAQKRFETLTTDRQSEFYGKISGPTLPWTVIRNVDSKVVDDPLFTTEPFCSLISETTLDAVDPLEFLSQATSFMNDTLWGTLNATIIIARKLEQDNVVGAGLETAIHNLRYGTIGINHWPAVGYGLASLPWGGHESATLANIQSGLGWVHNTFMLSGIDKSIIRGPLFAVPKPVWFYDHKKVHNIGPKIVDMEAAPSWIKYPGLGALAVQG